MKCKIVLYIVLWEYRIEKESVELNYKGFFSWVLKDEPKFTKELPLPKRIARVKVQQHFKA